MCAKERERERPHEDNSYHVYHIILLYSVFEPMSPSVVYHSNTTRQRNPHFDFSPSLFLWRCLHLLFPSPKSEAASSAPSQPLLHSPLVAPHLSISFLLPPITIELAERDSNSPPCRPASFPLSLRLFNVINRVESWRREKKGREIEVVVEEMGGCILHTQLLSSSSYSSASLHVRTAQRKLHASRSIHARTSLSLSSFSYIR